MSTAWLGATGIYVGAIASGLADVDAITLSGGIKRAILPGALGAIVTSVAIAFLL